MDDLVDLIASNESPAEISDRIKEILYRKAAEKIEDIKPLVASAVFGDEDEEDYDEEDEE
jgi:hypothetical protein